MIPLAQQHSIDMLPLRGKTKPAPREPFAQTAIAIYVCRSIHFTLNVTRLPRLSIFGTILIPGPSRVALACCERGGSVVRACCSIHIPYIFHTYSIHIPMPIGILVICPPP